MKKVMSLDVSSTSTGWSFLTEADNLLKYGTIQPGKKLSISEKLNYFRNELIKILKKYKPTYVVIEDTFLSKNPKVVKILAKFGGVAEQTVYEYTKKEPYIMSNTTPKSFFKVRRKEQLFIVMLNLLFLEESSYPFNKWNDIMDSIAQLLCYCDEILNINKIRRNKDYGYYYDFGGYLS